MPRPAVARIELVRKISKSTYYIQFAIMLLVIAAVVAAVVIGNDGNKPKADQATQTSACGPYRKDKTVQINGATIQAEVAKTQDELANGLGGRPCILADQGMLFEFRQPGKYAFWMKGLNFPIDIVWIGADKRVAALEIDVQPSTYPDKFINQDRLAQYVLELKAKRTKELKIDIGTPVKF